jgi:hypothetical protein
MTPCDILGDIIVIDEQLFVHSGWKTSSWLRLFAQICPVILFSTEQNFRFIETFYFCPSVELQTERT